MEVKLYRCETCGNIIIKLVDSSVPVVCCGTKMTELVPGSVDASLEKHVPVIRKDDGFISVLVGSTAHPMTEEHFISHVIRAVFAVLDGVEILGAYAYCNLHGFWKS